MAPPPASRRSAGSRCWKDTDGDGRFDTRTEFADGLTFPNGVMPWGDGLIVTCAPDILYLHDTDGDGQADQCRVWFTGFSTTGSTQLRVSHPTLGIDNWIYVTSGLTGGRSLAPRHPERPPLEIRPNRFSLSPRPQRVRNVRWRRTVWLVL